MLQSSDKIGIELKGLGYKIKNLKIMTLESISFYTCT